MAEFVLINKEREIAIQSDGDDMFKVAEPYRIKINGKKVIIPEGFSTNLASIPRCFWIIFPPFGRYTTPSIVHDYFYSTKKLTREEADLLFLNLMAEFKVSLPVRRFFYRAVRLFGGSHYNS